MKRDRIALDGIKPSMGISAGYPPISSLSSCLSLKKFGVRYASDMAHDDNLFQPISRVVILSSLTPLTCNLGKLL